MKLKRDEPLSNVAFNLDLRHYNKGLLTEVYSFGDVSLLDQHPEGFRLAITLPGIASASGNLGWGEPEVEAEDSGATGAEHSTDDAAHETLALAPAPAGVPAASAAAVAATAPGKAAE